MVFFLNLMISILYSERIGKLYYGYKLTTGGYLLLLSPLFVIWLLISSTQYYVGTDYGSYMEIFHGNNLDRYEIGFLAILKLFFSIGLKGQVFYFVFYSISFILLFLIFKELDSNIRYVCFFIITYICISNLFNNQLNGLRQAFATYIGTLGFVFYLKKIRVTSWLLFIAAISIHLSAIIYIIVLINPFLNKLKYKTLYLFIILGVFLSLTLNINLFYYITDYLPKSYANHIIYNIAGNRDLSSMMLKYILIPLYIYAISMFRSKESTKFEKNIFYWGILGFSLKLGLLGLPIISRISDFFILISIYPIYYLLKSLAQNKKYFNLICLSSFLVFLYFIKTVIFPTAEYSYQTIISNIF